MKATFTWIDFSLDFSRFRSVLYPTSFFATSLMARPKRSSVFMTEYHTKVAKLSELCRLLKKEFELNSAE